MTAIDNPAALQALAEARPEPIASPAPPVANILVVDDDARSRYALERTLEDPSLNIIAAESAEEAFKWLLGVDFALILLDVRMPGMDGYEAAALIRKREKSRHIPIIFLTAIDKDEVHIFRGYSAGAVDYVFKPVEPLVLKSKVAVFVDLYRKTEAVRREEEMKHRLERENFTARIERQRAEQALRASEERQTLILDALPLALYTAEFAVPFSGPRFIGPRIERIAGFPPSRFDGEGTFWAGRIHPTDRDRVLADIARIASEGSFATEYQWRRADATYGVFLDRAVAVPRPDGEGHEVVGVWLDVTEQRRLQEQLVHAQKIDAVGQLTGGIAHDFSNMLTAVLGNLDLLRRTLEPDSLAHRRTNLALQSAVRCADLTQRLLSFARQKSLQPSLVHVNGVIGAMMEILSRTLADNVKVDLRLAPDLWPVYVDRSQIESTLLNLAINARDALPDGGQVVIETANVSIAETDCDPGRDPPAGDYVLLTVADNGVGMPRAVRERVFEPFFTTKEPGHGTGLGLHMAKTFAEQAGGTIRIESEEGKGTSVQLFMRRTAGAELAEVACAHAGEDTPRARGHEVILAVDDDAMVLSVTAESLRDFGYAVIEAESPRAALEVLAGNRVDLLFTDISMPGGVNGRQLASEVNARYPETKILFVSGYTNRAGTPADPDVSLPRYLRKPYRDHELALAVRQALDETWP